MRALEAGWPGHLSDWLWVIEIGLVVFGWNVTGINHHSYGFRSRR